jgi:ATP-binding cassette subfamily B protein
VALLRRLLSQVLPRWPHITALFLLELLASCQVLLTPVPLALAVDCVVGSRPIPGFLSSVLPVAVTTSKSAILLLAAGLMVAIALLGKIQALASSLLNTYTRERIVLDFQSRLFARAQRLSLSYHDSRGTTDAVYRIQHDAQAIVLIVLDGMIPFLAALFTLGSMLYITVRLDWQLALVALAVAPVLFLVTWLYRSRLRRHARGVKERESSALSVVQEVLGALRLVKAFGQENREQQRLVRHYSEGMRARLRLLLVGGMFGLWISLVVAVGTAAVLYVGIRHVLAGVLTLGSLLLLLNYLSQLYAPLKTISKKGASLQSHLASAERAFALLDESPDVAERPDARPLERARGEVAFHQVSFAYGTDRPVLQDVTFAVEAGTRVGIMGTTGAGKTTLMNLLTRFHDPSTGSILIDGVDLRDYRLADLRDQFAIVLQEPMLFSSSLAENIAYARPAASLAEIIAAAKAANVHDFIAGLPDGYDTRAGERGMQLSGGERQRIALARAFLKDAPILILDEPTSAIDVKTEEAILEAMERLMEGRTTFLIAHRLSTLRSCDVLLRLERGRLVEPASVPSGLAGSHRRGTGSALKRSEAGA